NHGLNLLCPFGCKREFALSAHNPFPRRERVVHNIYIIAGFVHRLKFFPKAGGIISQGAARVSISQSKTAPYFERKGGAAKQKGF
ncbi:hypothetical protein, partial [Flavonifractor sp. An112]|uniref:hypothetical protein n=1 Tax=Flavonifractor sp. An112 TaxID=1965544 RepID=UPI001A9BAC91